MKNELMRDALIHRESQASLTKAVRRAVFVFFNIPFSSNVRLRIKRMKIKRLDSRIRLLDGYSFFIFWKNLIGGEFPYGKFAKSVAIPFNKSCSRDARLSDFDTNLKTRIVSVGNEIKAKNWQEYPVSKEPTVKKVLFSDFLDKESKIGKREKEVDTESNESDLIEGSRDTGNLHLPGEKESRERLGLRTHFSQTSSEEDSADHKDSESEEEINYGPGYEKGYEIDDFLCSDRDPIQYIRSSQDLLPEDEDDDVFQ